MRRTLWLDAKDLEWLILTVMDDASLGGVPDITDGDEDEAAVADGDKGEAAVADEPPVAQGSG
eukprot:9265515-Pyramimonas_sp.AAC.1